MAFYGFCVVKPVNLIEFKFGQSDMNSVGIENVVYSEVNWDIEIAESKARLFGRVSAWFLASRASA